MFKLYLLVFILIFIVISCTKRNVDYFEIIECNCENKINNKFISNNSKFYFASANFQTSEKKHLGNFSVKTTPDNPYALEFNLTDLKLGDFYNISVWSYSEDQNINLMVTTKDANYFSISNSSSGLITNKGWRLLTIKFEVTEKISGHDVKVFVWNHSNKIAYFDDLKIVKFPSRGEYNIKDTCLEIEIDSLSYKKLLKIRNISLNEGIITKDDSSWVKATMKYGEKKYKIDLRFKGDWSDHLSSKKWSFRISIKKNKSWKGLRTFSIHAPEARNYLSEWVTHKFFEKEDVLTTRYGFVPVKLNGKSMGIYAYEEHFEKQLVEYKNRREGPILKFVEDILWVGNKEVIKNNYSFTKIPYFLISSIVPFKKAEILANEKMKNQFIIAQNLLFQHKFQMCNTSEVFDVDKLAKYYALADIFKLYHGCFTWHNQRFYYNPVLSKLEPIMFDGFADSDSKTWFEQLFIGMYYKQYQGLKNDKKMILNLHPFSDNKFSLLYNKYIQKFSDSIYIDSVFNVLNNELVTNLNLLQNENPNYEFDVNEIYSHARVIRENLKSFFDSYVFFDSNIKTKFPDINFKNDTLTENYNFISNSLSAYIQQHISTKYEFAITNFYYKPLELIGFGKDVNKILIKLPKILYPANQSNWINKVSFDSMDSINYVFIRPVSKDTTIVIKINKWNYPYRFSPRQELEELYSKISPDFFVVNNNIIKLKNKFTKINKSVIIPKGYKLEISEGNIIDMTNNAIFISYSPVSILGSMNNPVVIKSSDKSANGFTVLQASEKSYLKFVVFDGLNTLDYKGWTLTGAVNFYESDVEISNSSFINNVCEDGLNIIRSKFIVKDSKFENTFGDAFDSDFSNGTVINCTFNKLNNDAIDFSGSVVEIRDCNISFAKDKGVSGGEKSTLTVKNIKVYNSNIGIASKDKSIVNVEYSNINNCNYGFVILQKKPEYGDSEINATNVILQHNKTEYLIEKGSRFNLNGKEIFGTEKKLAKQFYN